MRVIDCHTHFFSRPFFETLAKLAPGADEPGAKLARLAEQTGIDLPPADLGRHLGRWLEQLDKHQVDHMVTFASLYEEVPAVTEAMRAAGGRLSACAMVNPRTPGIAEELWSLLTESGFCGALLFPAIHHFGMRSEEAKQVLHVLDDRKALVFVHCGLLSIKIRDLLGLPRPYDFSFSNPLDVVPAANAARRAHFIIPHFGAGMFREALMAGASCENVYVDTSSSNSWIRTQPTGTTLRDIFRRALDVFGPDRILFGTDSNVFPAGWRAERFGEQKQVLDELGVSKDDQAKIFGGNAARLLGL
jgi:predicted TIM-barrel fold metal-dependent hydrolase